MVQKKWPRRAVDGVLLLDKGGGVTSNHALQAARRLFNAAKAGHTGTLDPMATGLLPLTFGEATKFSQMLLDADKTYEATITLGVVTDTGDADGKVLSQQIANVTPLALKQVVDTFIGEIEQVPPMHSALKRDGRPLYEYARAGIEVERAARKVILHTVEVLEGLDSENRFRIRVHCSKGTYIRTLAMDIGAALGCGAHLSGLRRTMIGPIDVGAAVTLDELAAMEMPGRDRALAPVDSLVGAFPARELTHDEASSILHGQPLRVVSGDAVGLVRLYDGQRFIGLGQVGSDGTLSPKRLISTVESA